MPRPTFLHLNQAARQRGAAILLAMLIMVLVTTVAAGTLWRQAQVMGVEVAERDRAQATWVLNGLLDWARIIIREDDKPSSSQSNPRRVDYLDEPWAKELKASSLSAFLALDKEDSGGRDEADLQQAFFSGKFQDLNAKFNLPDLINNEVSGFEPRYEQVFDRLCEELDIGPSERDYFKTAYLQAAQNKVGKGEAGRSAGPYGGQGYAQGVLFPTRLEQLDWLGIDPDVLNKLRPYVVIFLPQRLNQPRQRQLINVNTASRIMLKAAIAGCDDNCAQQIRRLSLTNDIKGFGSAAELFAHASFAALAEANEEAPIDGKSQLFMVQGKLQIDKLIVEEQAMLWRPTAGDVRLYQRERYALGRFIEDDSENAIGVDDLENFYKNAGSL